MSERISYAVIALTETQADEVISKLKKVGMNSLANWLVGNKGQIYGEEIEDWKPFKDQKIVDIINENASGFESETHCISELDDSCPDAEKTKHIQIFFIDLFAMYMEKYAALAKDTDYAFSDAKKANCCFLISYKLPQDVQEQLEKIYIQHWKYVSKAYKDGYLHRLAVRLDDVNNFKNFIKKVTANRPHPSADNAADEFLGEKQSLIKIGGE